MDIEVDHYAVLGLPSGEEGSKLSEKKISKAYRLKALELHPDKRPDDPNAHANFQKLKTSYEILKDEKARKLFDDPLRVKREKVRCQSQHDSKRRKMMSDLEERERAAFASDPTVKVRDEEERIARKLKEEIARILAMHANKAASTKSTLKKETALGGKESMDSEEKMLKVSWEKVGGDFEKFGVVEDVLIRNSKKKGSALIVMASKDAAVCHWECDLGSLKSSTCQASSISCYSCVSAWRLGETSVQNDGPKGNLFGAGYQTFEDSVLKKLQKAAERQK